MKKWISLLLAVAMLLTCFCGCKKKQRPEVSVGEVPENQEEENKLGDLIQALEDADGDIGKIIGVIGDQYGDLLLKELDELGLSGYVGVCTLALGGSTAVGTYGQLLELGFTSDIAPETPLAARAVTDAFRVQMGDAEAVIRVANPTDGEIPMGDGIICYYQVTSGVVEAAGTFLCGEATREDILRACGAPYAADEDTLVYHSTAYGTVDWGAVAEKLGLAQYEDDFSRTITFLFEDGVLVGVVMEAPWYLYFGLQDNVEPEELPAVPALPKTEVEEIREIRDSILQRLTKELEACGIDAAMDEQTGELVLDDRILFADNSAELTADGKAWLDRLFAVYGAVVLADEYRDHISAVPVEGHASPVGTYEDNLKLSQARAEAVCAYCLESEENGLSDAQKAQLEQLLSPKGYSFTDPVYREDGTVDMDASRRVAIKFCVSAA